MLTLFALVLVIGTVVDDSIVVVEAVQARFDAGYRSAYSAAADAMNGLASALFTTTLVFMVFFIPASFISGTSGIIYKQFGLTMAVSVGISLIVALTLAPALCALILKPRNENKKSFSQKVHEAYHAAFKSIMSHYTDIAMAFIHRKWLVVSLIVVSLVLAVTLMRTVPTGFVPDEDMGSLMVDISTPPGYTMAATNEVLVRASDHIQQLPEVESVGGVTGLGGSNKAMIQIQLHPWGERSGKEHSSRSVSEKIEAILAEETGARSFVMSPGMIDGYGRGGGFEF